MKIKHYRPGGLVQLIYTYGRTVLFNPNSGVLYSFTNFYIMIHYLFDSLV